MNDLPVIYLSGGGLWMPGCSGPSAWRARRRDAAASEPTSRLIAGRQARRLSLLAKMTVSVFDQAVSAAAVDPSGVPIVFGSTFGEMDVTVQLLEMLCSSGVLSPLRFQYSVHNAAIGVLSMCVDNRMPSVAVSGGYDIVGVTLLEAFCQATGSDGSVVVVFAEESPAAVLYDARFSPMAAGFVLSVRRPQDRAALALSRLRLSADQPPAEVEESLRQNPIAGTLALVDAIGAGVARTIRLDCGLAERPWCVDVEPTGCAES